MSEQFKLAKMEGWGGIGGRGSEEKVGMQWLKIEGIFWNASPDSRPCSMDIY